MAKIAARERATPRRSSVRMPTIEMANTIAANNRPAPIHKIMSDLHGREFHHGEGAQRK